LVVVVVPVFLHEQINVTNTTSPIKKNFFFIFAVFNFQKRVHVCESLSWLGINENSLLPGVIVRHTDSVTATNVSHDRKNKKAFIRKIKNQLLKRDSF